MEVKIDQTTQPTFVSLRGPLVHPAGQELEKSLASHLTEDGHEIILDLKEVERLDSRSLATLINLACRSNAKNGRLVFIQPNFFVQEVFRKTKIDSFLTVLPDLQSAQTHLASA